MNHNVNKKTTVRVVALRSLHGTCVAIQHEDEILMNLPRAMFPFLGHRLKKKLSARGEIGRS